MIALFALLPCAMVIVAVMGFRQSGVIAAAIACLTALAIWLSAIYSAPALLQLGQTVTDALVIEALVASVVLPGISSSSRAVASVRRRQSRRLWGPLNSACRARRS